MHISSVFLTSISFVVRNISDFNLIWHYDCVFIVKICCFTTQPNIITATHKEEKKISGNVAS